MYRRYFSKKTFELTQNIIDEYGSNLFSNGSNQLRKVRIRKSNIVQNNVDLSSLLTTNEISSILKDRTMLLKKHNKSK